MVRTGFAPARRRQRRGGLTLCLRGSRARAVMVALSAILVPAALTLMIGTRDKMKTSALLRDVVQRYDQDPKLTSSSAYGPKAGIDVDAHTSQAILRLQLVEKLRPGKGTTGFLEVDVAVGKWSHAYNVVGGNEPKLEESTLGSSNKGRNPGRTTTLDSYSTDLELCDSHVSVPFRSFIYRSIKPHWDRIREKRAENN